MAAPCADSSESSNVVPAEPPLGQQETLEMRAEGIKAKLKATHRQVFVLNQQLYLLKRRYKRAKRKGKYGVLSSISARMFILSGMKKMYQHYANAEVVELDCVFKQMEEESATAGDHSEGH